MDDWPDLRYGVYIPQTFVGGTVCLGIGDVGLLGSNCKILEWVYSGCERQEQKGAEMVGPVFGPSFVCRQCLCNAHNALCNRHGVKQPTVTEIFDFDEAIDEMVRLGVSVVDDCLANFDWYGKWCYSKQQAIRLSEEADPLMPDAVTAMVKRENSGRKRPSKSRLIQGNRNMRTQAHIGPETYAVQKALGSVLQRFKIGNCDLTMASGMNAHHIASWAQECLDRGAVQFYERDGKNWDATMQREHFALKYRLYQGWSQKLSDFVKRSAVVTGRMARPTTSGGLFRYRLDHTVKSGHNDTTLGNTLVNLLIATHVFNKLGIAASLIATGDDLIACLYDRVDLASVVALEAGCGIKPEARMFDTIEDVSFVSGIFWRISGRLWFTPKPGRLLARLWWTTSPPGRRKRKQYVAGVSAGLRSMWGFPGLRHLFDQRGSADPIGKRAVSHDVVGPSLSEDLCRAMADRYHVPVSMVVDFDDYMAKVPLEPCVVRHPMADIMMDEDMCDIDERWGFLC